MNGVRSRKECISIHAPTRGATSQAGRNGRCGIFQSTLPRGERHLTVWMLISMHRFQSTLPRGERLFYLQQIHCHGAISIHAPTRGATQCDIHTKDGSKISIHAPTRGATQMDCQENKGDKFQSTLPRGERPHKPVILNVGI